MLKVTYIAYGRNFVRVTNYSKDQAQFALEQICETVTGIHFRKIQSTSRLVKKYPTLESDVDSLVEQQEALRNIVFIK